MKVEEIERLLAEFYEGNTNEQEEELLKEAFRTEEVPEHLQKDKKLFLSFFPGEVVDNVPAGLEDKLSRMIDEKARVVEQNGKLKRYRNREDEILFMDLRQMGSPYEKKYIELTEEDRAKVTSVYHNWQQEGYEETYENVPEFCYSASFDEVKEKGFTLVPSRYIEFVNRDENIDFDTKMKSLQGELKELLAQEEKSKSDLLAVFKELGYEIEI